MELGAALSLSLSESCKMFKARREHCIIAITSSEYNEVFRLKSSPARLLKYIIVPQCTQVSAKYFSLSKLRKASTPIIEPALTFC